jgi:hypothetical protein
MHERIILNLTIKIECVRMQAAFIWLGIAAIGGLL